MDIEKVKELAEIFHDKRIVLETMAMMGISSDPDEYKKQTIELEVARAKMLEARKNLQREQGL